MSDPDGWLWAKGSDKALKAGQDLAGGCYCRLVARRGNLEWMALHHGLNHPSAKQPCRLRLAWNAEQGRQHGLGINGMTIEQSVLAIVESLFWPMTS